MTVGLPLGPSYITGRKYNNPTIQSIMNKIDPIAEAVDLSDHIDWRDPLGWSTLGQRWGDKTIGKKWREGQMQDVWDAIPKEWRPKIAESAMSAAEGIGNYWEGARTVDNWFNPLELAEAGTVRTLEGLALPFEGLAQLTSAGTGLDIELSRIIADFIPIGGIAKRGVGLARRGKLMKRLLDKIPAQTVYAAELSDEYKQFQRAVADKDYSKASELFTKLDMYEQRGADDLLQNLLHKVDDTDYVKGDWREFGYKLGEEPSQVVKAKNFSISTVQEISASLADAYRRVDKRVASVHGAKGVKQATRAAMVKSGVGFYWRNPATGKIYKVGWHKTKKRYTLVDKTRKFLVEEFSDKTARKESAIINKRKVELNKPATAQIQRKLEQSYNTKVDELVNQINKIDDEVYNLHRKIEFEPPYITSTEARKRKSIQTLINKRKLLQQKIEALEKAPAYIEHGYNLQNEKLVAHLRDMGLNVSLADPWNQQIYFDIKYPGKLSFKDTKDHLERILRRVTDERSKVYQYPNLVVNYNPDLTPGSYTKILIEELSKMVSDSNGLPSVMKPFIELDYDQIQFNNVDEIRAWLRKMGIADVVPAGKYPQRKKGTIKKPKNL